MKCVPCALWRSAARGQGQVLPRRWRRRQRQQLQLAWRLARGLSEQQGRPDRTGAGALGATGAPGFKRASRARPPVDCRPPAMSSGTSAPDAHLEGTPGRAPSPASPAGCCSLLQGAQRAPDPAAIAMSGLGAARGHIQKLVRATLRACASKPPECCTAVLAPPSRRIAL